MEGVCHVCNVTYLFFFTCNIVVIEIEPMDVTVTQAHAIIEKLLRIRAK